MAAFPHGAITSFLRDTPPLNPRKSIFSVSCASTSYLGRPTARKNHLRQKILRTLTKPTRPKLPQENPANPSDSSPLEEVREVEEPLNSEVATDNSENGEESREVEASVSDGIGIDSSAGTWATKESVFKYGFWLVGAFVFQTVCAVLFFSKNEGLNGYDDDKSSVIEFGGDEEGNKTRVKVFLNGGGGEFVYVDELEMERKIEEIRALAREAREKERLESGKNFNGDKSFEDDGEKHSKSVIEEEVDDKLIKLRKKLEKSRASSPENSRKESKARKEVSNGELDGGEANGALLFKKKYKYKGLDGNPMGKPKGFNSSDGVKRDEDNQLELSSSDQERNEPIHAVEEEKQKAIAEAKYSRKNSDKMVSEERGVRKQRKRKDTAKSKVTNVTEEVSWTHGTEALKSEELSVEAKGEITLDETPTKNDAKSAVKHGSKADEWWLNLPYVLAILMRRGENGEEGEGLYTLKSLPTAEDQHLPHIVAFEDRSDANNFCYLLLSFFEDLEDFSAQVVPLKAEELQSAAETYASRAVVVRRGQLRLFAGQPFSEAEMAVRGIINGD